MSSDSRKTQKLALQGGLKAVSSIEGKGKPKIGVEEFMAVAKRFGLSAKALRKIRQTLREEGIGGGPFLANYYANLPETSVRAYERTAREMFGIKYAIGTNSGTGALHAAFVAAGVGPGTEVICPAIGFFATASAVVTAKGVPIFCDVDVSLSIDPKKIEDVITPRTVAIAPTQIMGTVCDMRAIMKVARKHKLMVVEDCAQSCAGKFKGKYVGTFGDINCFSISAYKIVGGGEGGLILTNSERLWDRAQGIVEGGGLWRPDRFAAPRYEGELFCGTNYRMSELEAAVDTVQLNKADTVAKRFRTVRGRVLSRLKTYAEITPQKLNDPEGDVGYFLRFFPRTLDLTGKITLALQAEGVGAGSRGKSVVPDWHIYRYMYPVTTLGAPTDVKCPYECPVYTKRGGKVSYSEGDCPVADDLFDRVVTISLNQWYTAADCRKIAAGITKVLDAYCTQDPKATAWL